MSEPKLQGKSHDIPKKLVWSAWLKVKENGGEAEGEPLQAVESHVVGVVLPRAGPRGGDTEERRNEGPGHPERGRSGGADGGGPGIGAGSGEGLSRRLLRVSSRTVTLGRDSGMPQAVLGEGLGRRPRREGLLRHGLMGSDNEGGHAPYGPEMGPALCRALA